MCRISELKVLGHSFGDLTSHPSSDTDVLHDLVLVVRSGFPVLMQKRPEWLLVIRAAMTLHS